MPGLIIGTTMLVKVINSLAPSIRAASSISPGILSENCFIRNTPKGQPTVGKITAQMLSYSPSALISRISGIRMTCFGSAMAATMRLKIRYLPMKRFFARA